MCPSPYHSVRAAATPVSTVKIFREPSVASHVPGVCERVNTCRCSACCRSRVHKAAKIRVKNREPVPAYAMADADRDSDLGDDSPVIWNCGITVKKSVRSEGESSGEQSCESSDEGVGREIPLIRQPQHLPQQPLHQPHQPHHNMTHHRNIGHQMNNHHINNHQVNHTQQNGSPRPLDRDPKARDDFEALKTSLHPHLSSLASLAQGTSLSTPSSVFSLAGGNANFTYTPPAFLAPAPPPPAQPAGSASSSSSEGSAAGWSFEEQYKQVRQLYEISDDPRRKEFLDDLFAFMQRRGTPINRLPIMAKSVLDLYELYNLVIARGGLVEVINKKLWQEIIKGLRLPSSITSAAFTLRTQYMKYLYDYECEKNNISTRAELDAAIESNKREGRRSSGPFEASTSAMALMGRPQAVPLPMDQMPLQFQPYAMPSIAGVTGQHMPQPNQSQLTDMIRRYQFEALRSATGIANQLQEHEAESPSSTSIVSPSQALAVALNAIESGSFFNFIHHRYNRTSVDLEPQREALNLSESPVSTGSGARRRSRSPAAADTPPPTAKRSRTEATGAVAGPVAGPSSAPVAGPSSAPVAGPSSAPHRAVINSSENPNDTEESDASPPNRFLVANGYEGRRISFSLNDDATNSEVSVSLRINGVTFNGTLSRSPKGPNGLRQERP